MPDTIRHPIERRCVFDGRTQPRLSPDRIERDGFAMLSTGPALRWVLRIAAGAAQACGMAEGFGLGQPINSLGPRLVGDDPLAPSRLSARLGPDEWLLIAHGGPADVAEKLSRELREALGAAAHTLVDISHRNVAVVVMGPKATDVLNTGCPLDLDGSTFAIGSATRTLFAKSEVVLMRLDDDRGWPLFRLECQRSFGPYVQQHLANSATLLGCASNAEDT
ncbi:MAG: sarcosine oxidase subunit gamma [Alphaproteobacteria bacterium]|nr:sarcosine oxidase subunit gamma [Alphaproteobacteria bacterium]